MNKSRIEAFSDGMFAIIMTIMVLDLKIPHGGTFRDLIPVIPLFFCYLQSFLFVGVYWNNHHHLMHTVKKVNGKIIVANLRLLFWLSLIPFVTGWVGQNDFAPQSVVVYAIALVIPGFEWTRLQRAIHKNNPWSEDMKKVMKRQEKKGYISVALYLAAIPLAFVNPQISEGIFLLVSLMWFMPDKNVEKVLEDE